MVRLEKDAVFSIFTVSIQQTDERLTVNQDSVNKRVHGPYIRCPVCMTETPRKGEQPFLQLTQLAPICKRTESHAEDSQNCETKLGDVAKSGFQHGLGIQAIDPK